MNRLKFFIANLVILTVIYANTAVLANYALTMVWPNAALPIPKGLYDLFNLFGVFSYYEQTNRDVEIFGITAPSGKYPEGQVIKLSVTDYFPFSRGEIDTRINVYRHGYLFGPAGEQEAKQLLATKIKARYNRAHPDEPIEKLVVASLQWPRSFESYEQLKAQEDLQILYYE
jgi:hypothetical protein